MDQGGGDLNPENIPEQPGEDHQQQQPTATTNVASNTLHKLPVFWSNMPEVWFIQVEQIFTLNRILSDVSKYRHVVAVLPQEAMSNVIDLLRNPPENEKYNSLKQALISRHSLSENKRLEELLNASEIGDRSPSAFFRDMENSMGSSSFVNSHLLKRLWLRKLPEAVKVAITSSHLEDIQTLLTLADNVWEVTHTSSISSIASKPSASSSNREDKLIEAINALSIEVSSLKKNFSERRRNFGGYQGGRSRSRSRSRSRQNRNYCWYHTNFGDRASKCIQPCQYTTDKKDKKDLKE